MEGDQVRTRRPTNKVANEAKDVSPMKLRLNFCEPLPEPEKATHNGICPMCDVYISKNRSWVMKLPKPMAPRVHLKRADNGRTYWLSADTGKPYNYDGSAIRDHPRWYVHEKCYPKAIDVIRSQNNSDPLLLPHYPTPNRPNRRPRGS